MSNLTFNATMRGVVYSGVPFEMTVQDLPLPQIVNQTDAIVRITTSALCGSDLHIYRGFSGGTPPWNMGHEALGYIEEIGSAVSNLNVGDYVIISDTPSHGHLEMQTTAGDYFGNGDTLSQGLQAEYARVPYADFSLLPIPLTANTTNATIEQDYLTISDIWATAWAAVDYSHFEPGDSVAVFGAGPVGLLAAYSAVLRGASKVYIIDHVQDRLERGASIGAIPINFVESDPVAHLLELEPDGVRRSIDAVGFEALNSRLDIEQDIILQQMVAVTGYNGGIGVVGVHSSQPSSPGAPYGSQISPNSTFPFSMFWGKHLSMDGGPVDPKIVGPPLVELIASGRANPGFISTASIGIDEAPEYYRRFNEYQEIKVFIRFRRYQLESQE